MTDVLAAAQRAESMPLLARLRTYEGLPRLSLEEVQRLLPALEAGDFPFDGILLAVTAPMELWTEAAEDTYFVLDRGAHAARRSIVQHLVTRAAAEDITWRQLLRLRQHVDFGPYHKRWLPPAWPALDDLARASDAQMRGAAALVALASRRLTPPVRAAADEMLAAGRALDPERPDFQAIDGLLCDLAACLPADLAPLGPRIRALLSTPYVVGAAEIVGALGDLAARRDLEAAARTHANDHAAQAMIALTTWRLDGDARALAQALAIGEAEPGVAAVLRATLERATLTKDELDTLAARSTPRDPADAWAVIQHAEDERRAGLLTAAGLVERVRDFESDFRIWQPLVDAASATDEADDLIIDALYERANLEVSSALARQPDTATRFLLHAVSAGRDDLVIQLWCELPRDEFWTAIAS